MIRVLLTIFFYISTVSAEVITLLPYSAFIDYTSDNQASLKDKSILYGAHISVGTLSYLLALDYSHLTTDYKDKTADKLNQDDFTLSYATYSKTKMLKFTGHYIDTSDVELGNAFIATISVEKYRYFNYDKLRYGCDTSLSLYQNGHNELYEEKPIFIPQVTPYISYYKAININWGNTLQVKGNYQFSYNYVQKSYTSYEISDTMLYKSLFVTLKYYDGEMRTGVKDSGFTVFNSLDLMRNGFEEKIGYYLTKNTIYTLSYAWNRYREFDSSFETITHENKSSLILLSLSYSF
jgi:hypothetical protein